MLCWEGTAQNMICECQELLEHPSCHTILEMNLSKSVFQHKLKISDGRSRWNSLLNINMQ